MIAFACSQCGTKLKVQESFAGRSGKCPTCKQALTIPAVTTTVAFVPPAQIDGEESSLAKAGLNGGVTLDNALAARKAGRGDRQRYTIEGEIARGGMGAVLRAVDGDIRREVAVKYLLDAKDPGKQARFIEEGQINGQLEHPNIVPVYDLGIDAQQRPFILMKLVKGRSLKEVLDQLRGQPRQAERDYTLGRLLNILVSVCNALAFAHARGVIHRDLKPANIMLGDFGEVYVMDWGLAKVLGRAGAAEAAAASRSGSVVTSREPEADLTQDGAVIGTPVYMPPEQAAGKIQDIDQRSDVYALGAILYELLTLQPPVVKEGGQLGVLMQVIQGEVIPPEQRVPERARAGKVPRELAAIAMKALARDKDKRYASAEDFRRDIERFQEGRSVSAKEDTRREVLWKLVKRNKGFSAGAAAALLVLLFSTVFLLKAWVETRQAKAASEEAQTEKNNRTKQAVPALVLAARQVANNGDYASALKQIEVILDYDPANAEARLLRAQIFVAQRRLPAAVDELADYVRRKPDDTSAAKLKTLCERGKPDDFATLVALLDALQQDKMYGLAAPLLVEVQRISNDRQALLPRFQKQLEDAWPGHGKRLTLNAGQLVFDIDPGRQVPSLAALRGVPLNRLSFKRGDTLTDLGPLKGLPLTYIDFHECIQLEDLEPLRGMKLIDLGLSSTKVQDLGPLRGMPLTRLILTRTRVSDLEPLRHMKLTNLSLEGCNLVQDLGPLQGMPLTRLNLTSCRTLDLTPLKGMDLKELRMGFVPSADLAPLAGMPLEFFALPLAVKDMRPLEGSSVEHIQLHPGFLRNTPPPGLDVLRRLKKLKVIDLFGAGPMTPEEFWKRHDASEFKNK